MAENRLEGRVIRFALDGTGYGTNSAVSGRRGANCRLFKFSNALVILNTCRCPKRQKAKREAPGVWESATWRIRLGKKPSTWKIPFIHKVARGEFEMILRMMERQVDSPLTSSCGRFSDGVAAVIGIRRKL